MLIMIGLAVNYGMYAEAQSQLDMAADAAAMHAARVAAQLLQQNDPACESKGEAAGMAWFTAQQGFVPQAKNIILPTITVSCATNATSVTATVNYNGLILASFGNLVPANWPGKPNWKIVGAATAVISNPTYVEVLMLLDNSSSMMIGASEADIAAMEQLTPCSAQAAHEGQTIDSNYSWAYAPIGGVYTTITYGPPLSALSATSAPYNKNIKVPYGYGTFVYPALADNSPQQTPDIIPPLSPNATGGSAIGNCDVNFTGPSSECAYPGYILNPAISAANGVSTAGQCLNGQGGDGSILYAALKNGSTYTTYTPPATYKITTIADTPQAPCAFACHNKTDGSDYWGLAKAATNPPITLRYDVLQDAAANVISKMSVSPSVSRLSVGVYQFNAPHTANAQPSGMNQVYPAPVPKQAFATTEAGAVTAQAETLTQTVLPPVTDDNPDTNFENAMALLTSFVGPSGAGNYPAAPKKNLFIVTDGMDDYYPNPPSQAGRTQQAISPEACEQLKTPVGQFTPITHLPGRGFTVYVLYTQYYPLANPYYLSNDKAVVEGASPVANMTKIEYAMSQCASSPENFYEASDKASINTALQAMLAAALGSAGRLKS
jgi:hypothetical protein